MYGPRPRPQEDPAGFDYFHDVAGGQGRQRQRQVRDASLGRRRGVSPPARSPGQPEADRLQGYRRNQHRRPVAARTPGPAPTSCCTPGRAQEPAPGHQADETAPAGRSSSSRPEEEGSPVAYVGDVVGTGSSRKSATNSVLWFTARTSRTSRTSVIRRRLPGLQDRPDLLQHQEDAGALPSRSTFQMDMGDVLEVKPYDRQGHRHQGRRHHRRIPGSRPRDPRRSPRGGRINLIIGRLPHHQGPRGPRPCPVVSCSARRPSRRTPARASRWRRRWSAAPAACRGQGIRPAPTASPR